MPFRDENRSGTPQERKRKGAAALTEEEVRVIKRRLLDGEEVRPIAQEYGMGVETIRKIKRGDSWWWVEAGGKDHSTDIKKSAQSLLQRLNEEGHKTQGEETLNRLMNDVNKRAKLEKSVDELKEEKKDE